MLVNIPSQQLLDLSVVLYKRTSRPVTLCNVPLMYGNGPIPQTPIKNTTVYTPPTEPNALDPTSNFKPRYLQSKGGGGLAVTPPGATAQAMTAGTLSGVQGPISMSRSVSLRSQAFLQHCQS